MPRPFLTARWANLAIVSYAVPPAMLGPYLPEGPGGTTLEIETRTDLPPAAPGAARPQPSAFVSLVGFQFKSCRVLGVPWPRHTEFAEINLRFYVRSASNAGAAPQRGVVFIREFVPKPLIAYVARRFYNEPYISAPCTAKVTQTTSTITAEYTLTYPPAPRERVGGTAQGPPSSSPAQTHRLSISGRKPVIRPGPTSTEHWFKEHRWGFGMLPPRGGRTRGVAYEVIHPTWGIYPVERHGVSFDFAAVYGPDWGFLAGATPVSVLLAQGSDIAVFPPRRTLAVQWGVKK